MLIKKRPLEILWNLATRPFQKKKPERKNVAQIYSKKNTAYSPEKQKSLETLCEKLFEQQELITTGRMQFLGLNKIKRKLGKTWAGLQIIVYETVESAITKYTMPSDIFIRYKDDTYVIIFAKTNLVEAQIKLSLIAEEIRRQLFQHEEEALRDIEIEEKAAPVKTKTLKKVKDLPSMMDVIFQNAEEMEGNGKQISYAQSKMKLEIPAAIEVDTHANTKKNVQEEQKEENLPSALGFSYMPLWDVKNNLLTTYLCLASQGFSQNNLLDNHEAVFKGLPSSEKTRIDLLVLSNVAKELRAMAKDDRKLYIACPVHYETLYRGDSYEKYVVECQKIPKEHKRYLIFLLLDLPAKFHEANIHKFSIPLRNHCSAIYAQVLLDTGVDFAMLRECRFDAIGVRLKKSSRGEKHLLEVMEKFVQKAKGAFIQKVFALDVASLSITTSAVCANYDLLGGTAIHESVTIPDSIYRYQYESLFSDLLKDQ